MSRKLCKIAAKFQLYRTQHFSKEVVTRQKNLEVRETYTNAFGSKQLLKKVCRKVFESTKFNADLSLSFCCVVGSNLMVRTDLNVLSDSKLDIQGTPMNVVDVCSRYYYCN